MYKTKFHTQLREAKRTIYWLCTVFHFLSFIVFIGNDGRKDKNNYDTKF
jgi:hypothetical protein